MHNVPDNSLTNVDASSIRPPPSYRTTASTHPSFSPITRRTSSHGHHHHHSPRSPTEHVYSLFDSRTVPWASLKLFSNVGSPRYLPAYFEGQTIQGALELDLRKPETILGVNLTLSGTIMAANAPDPRVFWELNRVLWNAEMGDPHSPSTSQNQDAIPSPTAPPSRAKGKLRSKLVGFYSWPFVIQLPSTCLVALHSKQEPVLLPLPPSFSEKGAAQFINYEIIVRIRRGPLRIDSKLGTHFGFAPRTRPPAPSLLRQLAHKDNKPLVGPEGDPDGWTVLPPILVRGKLFGVLMIEAICTFALALPLTYSRGQPIPLMLTIACSDEQALDLVFTPQNISVHLIREVCYCAGSPDSSSKSWGSALGIESAPEDRTLLIRASTPGGFDHTRRLPRAITQSDSAAPTSLASGFASSSSGSVLASADAEVIVETGESVDSTASLARSGRPSLYSHPTASVSMTSSSMASRSTLSFATLSVLSTLSSLSFGSRSAKGKKRISSMFNGEKEKERRESGKAPKVGPKLALHGARTPITSAVWWPGRSSNRSIAVDSTAMAEGMRSRKYEGEILLPKDLVPSFEFGGFSVKYALALLPFQAPGFELLPSSSFTTSPSSRTFSAPSPQSPTPSSPTSPYSPASSPSTFPSTSTSRTTLKLTHEPLPLSLISITTLPHVFAPSPSASSLGSPASPGSPPFPLPPGIPGSTPSTSITLTQAPVAAPIPRSRIPPEIDANAQRTVHAERIRKPVVWGLFNQFVSGGQSTVAGSASVD